MVALPTGGWHPDEDPADFYTERYEEPDEQARLDFDRRWREAARTLDGTDLAAVSLLTGLSPARIDELGGLP